MLTEDQKDAIRDLIPKTFTVSATTFNATCLYTNQFMEGGRPTYAHFNANKQPLIALEYDKTLETDIVDLGGFEVDTVALLINVYAVDIDTRGQVPGGEYVHGPKIVDQMTRDIKTAFKGFNAAMKQYGMSINVLIHKIPVNDLSEIASKKHMYRQKFTIPIIYEV